MGNEVSASPCLSVLACKQGSEPPSAGSECQWVRVYTFGLLKPVSIWDNPPPALHPQLAGQRPLSSKRETSRLAMEPSPQGSRRRRRETPEMPDNCGPHNQASSGTSQPTSIQHPSRQGVFLSTCEIPSRPIPASFSGNLLLWIASV